MGSGEIGLQRQRVPVTCDGFFQPLTGTRIGEVASLQVGRVGLRGVPFAPGAGWGGAGDRAAQPGRQGPGDSGGDFLLNGEHVAHVTVVAL